MVFSNRTLVVVGGSSGIGLRLAMRAAAAGAEVIIGGRDPVRLANAVERIGHGARGASVDSRDRGSLQRFFAPIAQVDMLFTPGASYQVGAFASDDVGLAQSPFDGKFWPQYWAVHAALPKLSNDAAIVLVAGAAGARPIKGGTAYAACNAAIEGLARGLATELAPQRVNVISPGTLDGELWQARPAAQREAAFDHARRSSLLQREGGVEDAADAAFYLLGNRYTTGSTLYPDGGYALA